MTTLRLTRSLAALVGTPVSERLGSLYGELLAHLTLGEATPALEEASRRSIRCLEAILYDSGMPAGPDRALLSDVRDALICGIHTLADDRLADAERGLDMALVDYRQAKGA